MKLASDTVTYEIETVEPNCLFAHWHGRLRYVIDRMRRWTSSPLPHCAKERAQVINLIRQLEQGVDELGDYIANYASPSLDSDSFEAIEIESRFDIVDCTIERLDSMFNDCVEHGAIYL